MERDELFKRLDQLTIKFHYSTIEGELSDEHELDSLAEEFQKLQEISDKEAWIIINFLDRNLVEITDGYWGTFFDLTRDLAPGWPYGNELLLKIPTGDGGLTDIKTESLGLFNDSIKVNTNGFPFKFKPAGLDLENYWKMINWRELTEAEFRFLLIVLAERGKYFIASLEMNSSIALAIDKFKTIGKLEKNEKIGLRWLSEFVQDAKF